MFRVQYVNSFRFKILIKCANYTRVHVVINFILKWLDFQNVQHNICGIRRIWDSNHGLENSVTSLNHCDISSILYNLFNRREVDADS